MIKILSNPTSVRFEDLDRLASLVGALSDYHDEVGVRVMDEVTEFIRLALEVNNSTLQQRCTASISYLGQLFNYNVCGTQTVFKVFYFLIVLKKHKKTKSQKE